MQKKYITIGAAILGLLIVFVIVWNLRGAANKSSPPGSKNTIPDYVLGAAEELQVKEFVQNFVSLYNTYSSGDLSNVQALEDYETPAMQELTDKWVADKTQSLPEGFSVRTTSKPETFTYTYSSGQQLQVTMDAVVSESASASSTPLQFTDTSITVLQKNGSGWLVDSITYEKH